MMNHLWQSTIFAIAAWMLALALRKNRAAWRYRVWFAASVKFLIPFAALVAIGQKIEWRPAAEVATVQVTAVIEHVAQPFSVAPGAVQPINEDESNLPRILLAIWLAGAAVSASLWIRQWLRARRTAALSKHRGLMGGVEIRETEARIEPGIFGVFRPVLLVPRGIEERLTPEQLSAIFAHELAHVRRRDNLTAFIHMIVETIFWFHPAVWLIRWKLAEERERACDEAALEQSAPEIFAEGILSVCRFYVESRMACVAGVSGGDLKKRIESIMADRAARLSIAKRAMLAAAAVTAVAGPVALGLIDTPRLFAQSVSFDVASVKSNSGSDPHESVNFEPGRFRVKNFSLAGLIAIAYDLPITSSRLSGGPDWVRSQGFDVEAKADLPGLTAKAREKQMRRMLQSLLEERFHLVLRRETKEMPIYVLTVAKGGPKLTKSDIEEKDCPEGDVNASSCHIINGGMGRGLHARAADTSDIVWFVGNWADRPLIDKTGLKGLYKLDTEGWIPMAPRMPRVDGQTNAEDLSLADPARPTMFMMFEKLGLKMEPQRGPVDMFYIDHAERPAAN